MAGRTSQSKLRNYIKSLREDLFTALQYLWDVCEELHTNQNRADGTENGIRHVEQVEENIWRLIDESEGIAIGDFLPEELFVLSAASCCHDLDKALEKYDEKNWPFDLMHGSGSAEFVMKNYHAIGFKAKGRKNLARRVCEICSAHSLNGTDFQQAASVLSTTTATPGGAINMHRATVVLKVADILHTDETRIHSSVFQPGFLKGKERSKYLARSCIRGWNVAGDTLVIEAEHDTDEQLAALKACETYMMQTEWPGVAQLLSECNFPLKLKFKTERVARGIIVTPESNIIEADRTRHFEIEFTRDVLKIIGRLSSDYVCRNQYVLRAMGSAVLLLAVDVVVERLRYVESHFVEFSHDLAEEEVYSLEKLGEHIGFLSHLRSILKQLIKESVGKYSGGATKPEHPRSRGDDSLAQALRCLPGCREILRDDLSDTLLRLEREIRNFNNVLLKVENRIAELLPGDREAARSDPKKYHRIIRPVMRAFFPVLHQMGDEVATVATKVATFSDRVFEDLGHDFSDILLSDDVCRPR